MVRYAFVLALVACEPMPNPSGDLTRPVQDAAPEPVKTVNGDPVVGGFDFDADARSDEDEVSDAERLSDAELQARLLGVDVPASVPAPAPAAAPEPTLPVAVPIPVATAEVTAVPRGFDMQQDLPANWGLRLVSTVLDADPPRAIIGFPDGHEEVVQAGTLLPEEGVAVLAIGNNAVQIAEIIPEGDHARVESRVISALFPQQPAQP
jgi:hypothetical protein